MWLSSQLWNIQGPIEQGGRITLNYLLLENQHDLERIESRSAWSQHLKQERESSMHRGEVILLILILHVKGIQWLILFCQDWAICLARWSRAKMFPSKDGFSLHWNQGTIVPLVTPLLSNCWCPHQFNFGTCQQQPTFSDKIQVTCSVEYEMSQTDLSLECRRGLGNIWVSSLWGKCKPLKNANLWFPPD